MGDILVEPSEMPLSERAAQQRREAYGVATDAEAEQIHRERKRERRKRYRDRRKQRQRE